MAASVDSLEKTTELAEPLSFPVAWGVQKETAEVLGAFWDNNRHFIQPTEFIINAKGRVLMSTYSSSPLGRIDPDETLLLLKYLSSLKKKDS